MTIQPIPKTNRKREKARRKAEHKKKLIELHNIVCERAKRMLGTHEFFKCFHCNQYFFRDEVCADHFPDTKAARPEIRYDPDACVCSCMACNTSGNKNRQASFKRLGL